MAAPRRIVSISYFLRIYQNTHSPTPSSSISKPFLTNISKTTPPPSLNSHLFHRHITSSAAVDTFTETTTISSPSSSASHPWPEWVTFVGKLKSKGYWNENSLSFQDDDGGTGDDGGVIGTTSKKDLDVVKNACLNFARERFDLFNSLSREHIRAVVECGCPNLFRKPVNSAKRLRATLGLDEGDVCSACNLRGSCDRAYGILKDSEASARTVDIVRMLLIYALDPLVLSGGERPHDREHVEASARKLLSELSDLSETAPDPALPKPAMNPPNEKQGKVIDHGAFPNAEMKRGDWICSNCNFMNFSRNLRCLQCKTEGPKKLNVDDVEMKKGDWNCPQCQFMNFARNCECLRCRTRRPRKVLLPGEWECPSCDFVNYSRNKVCLKCNCDRPTDEVAEYEEQIWRRPR